MPVECCSCRFRNASGRVLFSILDSVAPSVGNTSITTALCLFATLCSLSASTQHFWSSLQLQPRDTKVVAINFPRSFASETLSKVRIQKVQRSRNFHKLTHLLNWFPVFLSALVADCFSLLNSPLFPSTELYNLDPLLQTAGFEKHFDHQSSSSRKAFRICKFALVW